MRNQLANREQSADQADPTRRPWKGVGFTNKPGIILIIVTAALATTSAWKFFLSEPVPHSLGGHLGWLIGMTLSLCAALSSALILITLRLREQPPNS